jgi:peroxiredoxin Q/BCP
MPSHANPSDIRMTVAGSGTVVTLKSLKGKQVVLYFYPKDDTSGCTKEACDFRDSLAPIKKAGAVVLGVSKDGKASHQKFIAKYGLPFALLSDEDAAVSTAYEVYKEKSMYGRKYLGIERSTFVIDATGRSATTPSALPTPHPHDPAP